MDLVDIALAFGAPAYIVLQLIGLAVARLRGWRVAFMLPLVVSLPVAVWCAVGLARGSNLWALPFVLFGPFGALYLIVVLVARALTLPDP